MVKLLEENLGNSLEGKGVVKVFLLHSFKINLHSNFLNVCFLLYFFFHWTFCDFILINFSSVFLSLSSILPIPPMTFCLHVLDTSGKYYRRCESLYWLSTWQGLESPRKKFFVHVYIPDSAMTMPVGKLIFSCHKHEAIS